MTVAAEVDHSEQQQRTLRTLRLAQVPGQAAVAGVVAVGALLAKDLLHDNDRFAGSGGAAFTFGAAFLAVPLSAFMRRNGRRPGLMFAFGLGAIGAVIAGVGGQLRSFPLFLVGMLCFGGAQAATLQGRYVAGPECHREVWRMKLGIEAEARNVILRVLRTDRLQNAH